MPPLISIDRHGDQSYYEQIRQCVIRAIDSGELRVGDRLPTIRQIVDETELAFATVHRAIRSLVDDGLLSSRPGIGTVVSTRAITGGVEVRSIGIVSHVSLAETNSSPYFRNILLTVQELCVSRGYAVTYDRWSLDRPLESLFGTMRAVNGVVVLGGHGVTIDDLLPTVRRGMPLVCVGDRVRHAEIQDVHSDNVYGARTAVSALIEAGHRRIAIAGASDRTVGSGEAERFEGYRQALEHAGLTLDRDLVLEQRGVELGRRLAAMQDFPSALFVAESVSHFASVLPPLYAAGRHIGRDLYVCAYDENCFGTVAELGVPYSRVVQPVADVARLAVEILLEQADGDSHGPDARRLPLPILQHLDDRGQIVPTVMSLSNA